MAMSYNNSTVDAWPSRRQIAGIPHVFRELPVKVCPACGAEYGDDAVFCAQDRAPLTTVGGGLVGQLLGERYQIERKLGEGGMGEVYLARHVMMGRPCAVKVVSAGLSRDPDAIGRFNREATNASRISHPNVCAVYDFGVTAEGAFYLAMEYLEGRTLTEALKAGPLPLERAVAILRQCAAGLAAAHELGIVHRDLKPDNVMLLDHKGRETVKVVDFGIAKAATGEGAQRVTRTGLVVGTPEYMSPEQISSDGVDGRSDQYSLALLFFRMLTGALPFTATSAHEAMAKRLTERPRPLALVAPDRGFPPALQPVLDRALERKPEARYPSVEAFADAVAAAVQPNDGHRGEVALPRTEVVAHRAGPWRGLVAGGVGLALVGTAFVAWRRYERPAPNPAAQAPVPVPPPQAPDPAPPPVESTTTRVVAPPQTPGPTASVPTLTDFDQPRSPRAKRAYAQAVKIAGSARWSDSIRAEMGLLAAVHLADTEQRRGAAEAVRNACRRYRLTSCQKLLDQYKDVP